jgi:mannosyltransferase
MTTVTLDDIIYRLQRFGGASDFWRSLSTHLDAAPNLEITHVSGRPATRLLPIRSSDAVLHSSHFRVPIRRTQGCVTTIHDLTYELGLVGGRGAPVNRWQRKLAVEHADAIVCISEHTRNDLLTYYQGSIPTDSTVAVIHHGRTYETPTSGPLDAAFERFVPYVLHVGNRSGYKNFPILAQAFLDSDLPGAGVSLVCTGAPFDAAEQALIEGHRSSNSVRNVGQVTTEALGRLYEHALGLAYPSAYEGFGLPPLDAMSLGCPVLSTDNTSVPEIVGDAGILVDPADRDGFRIGLELLLDPTKRNELAAAGKARAQSFSWTTAAAQYADTYTRVAVDH